jgi:hypothetical protein
MTMSTGDSRRSPQKSTTAAATGGKDPEATDEPVGGVLPVKKAARPAKAGNGSAGSRSNGSGATRAAANGNGSSAAKATPAKAAPAKATGSSAAKASPSKTASAPSKAAGAKSTAGLKTANSGRRTTVTETLDSSRKSVFAGGRATAGGGKSGGKRPITPVRVAEKRNWGPILLYITTGVVALGIIGYGVYPVIRDSFKGTWQEQVAGIAGVTNYIDPGSPGYNAASTLSGHQAGDLSYEVSPPVGGNHNSLWQSCMGEVYTSQIADEHAVHSLEHGAVWITYRPDLPQDQIDRLAERVSGREYLMMSPYPNLDTEISLQAWGHQLKVTDAGDERIDEFISALRINATQETGAVCSGGITDARPTPLDFEGGM